MRGLENAKGAFEGDGGRMRGGLGSDRDRPPRGMLTPVAFVPPRSLATEVALRERRSWADPGRLRDFAATSGDIVNELSLSRSSSAATLKERVSAPSTLGSRERAMVEE